MPPGETKPHRVKGGRKLGQWGVDVQRKGPRQMFRGECHPDSCGSRQAGESRRFPGGGGALFAVWGMGSSVLTTALEAVAVAVHFQDMHVVGETVQQRVGEPFRTEHVGPPNWTKSRTFTLWTQ